MINPITRVVIPALLTALPKKSAEKPVQPTASSAPQPAPQPEEKSSAVSDKPVKLENTFAVTIAPVDDKHVQELKAQMNDAIRAETKTEIDALQTNRTAVAEELRQAQAREIRRTPVQIERLQQSLDAIDKRIAGMQTRVRPDGFGIDVVHGKLDLNFITRGIGYDSAFILSPEYFKGQPGSTKVADYTILFAEEGTPLVVEGLEINHSILTSLHALRSDPDPAKPNPMGEDDKPLRRPLRFMTVAVPQGNENVFLNADAIETSQAALVLWDLVYDKEPDANGELQVDQKKSVWGIEMNNEIRNWALGDIPVVGSLLGGGRKTIRQIYVGDAIAKIAGNTNLDFGDTKIQGLFPSGRFTLTNLDLAPTLNNQVAHEERNARYLFGLPEGVDARAIEGINFKPITKETADNPILLLKEVLSRLIKSGKISADFDPINIDQIDKATGLRIIGQLGVHSGVRMETVGIDVLNKFFGMYRLDQMGEMTEAPYLITEPKNDAAGHKLPQITFNEMMIVPANADKDSKDPQIHVAIAPIDKNRPALTMNGNVYAATGNSPAMQKPSAVLRNGEVKTGKITITETTSNLNVCLPKGLDVTVKRFMVGHGPGVYIDYLAIGGNETIPSGIIPKNKQGETDFEHGHVDFNAQDFSVKIPVVQFTMTTRDGKTVQGELRDIESTVPMASLKGGQNYTGSDLCGEEIVQKIVQNAIDKIPYREILNGFSIENYQGTIGSATVRYTEAGKVDVVVDLKKSTVKLSSDGLKATVKASTDVTADAALPDGTYHATVSVHELQGETGLDGNRVLLRNGGVNLTGHADKVGDAEGAIDAQAILSELAVAFTYDDASGRFKISPELGTKLKAMVQRKGEKIQIESTLSELPAAQAAPGTGDVASEHSKMVGHDKMIEQAEASKKPTGKPLEITVDPKAESVAVTGDLPSNTRIEYTQEKGDSVYQNIITIPARISFTDFIAKMDSVSGTVGLETGTVKHAVTHHKESHDPNAPHHEYELSFVLAGSVSLQEGGDKAFVFGHATDIKSKRTGEVKEFSVQMDEFNAAITMKGLKSFLDEHPDELQGDFAVCFKNGEKYIVRFTPKTENPYTLEVATPNDGGAAGEFSMKDGIVTLKAHGSADIKVGVTAKDLKVESMVEVLNPNPNNLTITYDTNTSQVSLTGNSPVVNISGTVETPDQKIQLDKQHLEARDINFNVLSINDLIEKGTGQISLSGSVAGTTQGSIDMSVKIANADGSTSVEHRRLTLNSELRAALQNGTVKIQRDIRGALKLITDTKGSETDITAALNKGLKEIFNAVDVQIDSIDVNGRVQSQAIVTAADGSVQDMTIDLPYQARAQHLKLAGGEVSGEGSASLNKASFTLYLNQQKDGKNAVIGFTVENAAAAAGINRDTGTLTASASATGVRATQSGSGKGVEAVIDSASVDLAINNIKAVVKSMQENGGVLPENLTGQFNVNVTGGKNYLVRYWDESSATDIKATLEQALTVKAELGNGGSVLINHSSPFVVNFSGTRKGNAVEGKLSIAMLETPGSDFKVSYDSASGKLTTNGRMPDMKILADIKAGAEHLNIDAGTSNANVHQFTVSGFKEVLEKGQGQLTFGGEGAAKSTCKVDAMIDGQSYQINLDYDIAAALRGGTLDINNLQKAFDKVSDAANAAFGVELRVAAIAIGTNTQAQVFIPGENTKGQWHNVTLPATITVQDLVANAAGISATIGTESKGIRYYLLQGERNAEGLLDTTKTYDMVQMSIEEVTSTTQVNTKDQNGKLDLQSRTSGIVAKAAHVNDVWGEAQVAAEIEAVELRANIWAMNELGKGNTDQVKGRFTSTVINAGGKKYNVYAKVGGPKPLEIQAALKGNVTEGEINPEAGIMLRISNQNDPIEHDVRVGQPGDTAIFHNIFPGYNLKDAIQVTTDGKALVNITPDVVMQTYNTKPTGTGQDGELVYDVAKDPQMDGFVPAALGDEFARTKFKVETWEMLTPEQQAQIPKFVDLPYAEAKRVLDAATEGRISVNVSAPKTLNAITHVMFGPEYLRQVNAGKPGKWEDLKPEVQAKIPGYYDLSEDNKALVRFAAQSSGYVAGADAKANETAIMRMLFDTDDAAQLDASQKAKLKVACTLASANVHTAKETRFVKSPLKSDFFPVIHAKPLSVERAQISMKVDPSKLKQADPLHHADHPDISRMTEDSVVNLKMVLYNGPEARVFHVGESDTAYQPNLVNELTIWVGKVKTDEKGELVRDDQGRFIPDPTGSPYGVMFSRYGVLRERTAAERKPGEPSWTVDWTVPTNTFKVYDPTAPSGVQLEKREDDDGFKRMTFGISKVEGFIIETQRGKAPKAKSTGHNEDGTIQIFDLVNLLTFGGVPKFTTFDQQSPWTDIPLLNDFASQLNVANKGLAQEFADPLNLLGADHPLTLPNKTVNGNIVFTDPETKKEVKMRVSEGIIANPDGTCDRSMTMDENGFSKLVYKGKVYRWKFNMDGTPDRAEMRFVPDVATSEATEKKAASDR